MKSDDGCDVFKYSYWRTRRKCKTTFAVVLLFGKAIGFPTVSITSIVMSLNDFFSTVRNRGFQRLRCRRLWVVLRFIFEGVLFCAVSFLKCLDETRNIFCNMVNSNRTKVPQL